MLRSNWVVGSVALLGFIACGGGGGSGKSEAASPDQSSAASAPAGPAEASTDESEAASPPASDGAGVPTRCSGKGDLCTPDPRFVERLCKGNYPGVALYLFANKSPWARGYLRGETEAWNASGGASETGKLAFDEEVLILRKRATDMGGMQVSGAGGGYDALRWNGSCVTLEAGEVTLDVPPKPKAAKIDYRLLDDSIQESLRADPKVDEAVRARKQECKGAHSGEVSLKCVKADARLSEVIVEFVRQGGALAVPERVP